MSFYKCILFFVNISQECDGIIYAVRIYNESEISCDTIIIVIFL